MGTVQNDEFCHHLWVVNGKEPRYGPPPVMTHEAASVVPLEEKQRQTLENVCNRRQRPDDSNRSWMVMLMLCCSLTSMSVLKISIVQCHYRWLPLSEDIYPQQMIYYMTYSQTQIKVRTSVGGILITLLFQSLRTNLLTYAATIYTYWYESSKQDSSQIDIT